MSCDWQGETLALVKDVPACGYRVLRLGRGTRVTAQPVAGLILDSRDYHVVFDTTSGAVTSVIEKDAGRELVDVRATYRLNQYLYVSGGKGTDIEYDDSSKPPKLDIASPQQAKLKHFKLGDLGEAMVVETFTAMTPKLTSTVMVWNGIKRVDFDNHLTKTKTYDKEAGYFAFPFAADKPSMRYEIPVGVMDVSKDMLPGACLDWFTIQHFVEVSDHAGAIAWATPDAPLACFQDINRGLWKTALPMVNGHIYGYVFNNYWWTNYCAGQGGDLQFRFSITSRNTSDLAASARFGAGVSSALRAVITEANPQGVLKARSAGLLTIAETNAQLIGLRQAVDGKGIIVRLLESSGLETTVHLDVKALGISKASACNIVENGAAPLEIKDGVVSVPLRAHGVATVRLD